MKIVIKAGAGFGGKIATGSYENASPSFYGDVSYETEVPDGISVKDFAGTLTEELQTVMHQVSYGKFKQVEQQMLVERIQRERKDLRFRDCSICNKKHPSVTSILNFDADFFMPDYQLEQYAALGNIKHARTNHFIKTGKWVHPRELREVWADIVIVTKGDLKLNLEEGNFENFVKDYPFKEMHIFEEALFNHEEDYSGLPDDWGIPDISKGKWSKLDFEVKELPTLISIKSSIDKDKNFAQEAAYQKCLPDMKQMLVVALNDNQCGFTKPILSDKFDFYYTLFHNKHKAFNRRYGL